MASKLIRHYKGINEIMISAKEFLPPAYVVRREGNVFTRVCKSVCPHPLDLLHGGRYASCVHAGGLSCFSLVSYSFYWLVYSQLCDWYEVLARFGECLGTFIKVIFCSSMKYRYFQYSIEMFLNTRQPPIYITRQYRPYHARPDLERG